MMALKGDDHQTNEILLLPFFGQGHLFPFIELLKHLSSLQFSPTLLLPSSLSPIIPFTLHHLIEVVEIPSSTSLLNPPPGSNPLGRPYEELVQGIESLLAGRAQWPICAIVDIMMSWAQDVFQKLDIPIVALFTSGPCAAAREYGSWKAHVSDLGPEEVRVLPGLPKEIAISYLDLKREAQHHPPPYGGPPPPRPNLIFPHGQPKPDDKRFDGPPSPGLGSIFPPRPPKPKDKGFEAPPPGPGQRPHWIDEVEGTVGIMMNTCHELEGPFLNYIDNPISKPVWGVGPLLPKKYWKRTKSLVHDNEIRANKQSNYTEEEVNQWLDSKPRGSVLYISFGSEVGPTLDEYKQLASALKELEWQFIWVIRTRLGRLDPPLHLAEGEPDSCPEVDYYPDELESKVRDQGLIICNWAPQLLILSHPSTGGFLSHCGWNSTMEAIVRGVPILAWPIRGDQHHNANLVVNHLKAGYMIKEDECSSSFEIVKDDIVGGIQKLMSDHGIKERANTLRSKFEGGFPASSNAALDSFTAFIVANKASA